MPAAAAAGCAWSAAENFVLKTIRFRLSERRRLQPWSSCARPDGISAYCYRGRRCTFDCVDGQGALEVGSKRELTNVRTPVRRLRASNCHVIGGARRFTKVLPRSESATHYEVIVDVVLRKCERVSGRGSGSSWLGARAAAAISLRGKLEKMRLG